MDFVKHTTVNVSLVLESFYIPQLHRMRRIWMYRPDGYNDSDKRYPVVYMHDGQNLFDEATAFDAEWGVDETLNHSGAQCIVIGIENSEYRMTEYNCKKHEEHGEAEGKQYLDFIVNTLKPYIDSYYKTLPGRDFTYIAGSSMGGLISLYGALHHPETFSSAGIFSPSLWIVPNPSEEFASLAEQNQLFRQRLYFYGGEKEDCNVVENINDVTNVLQQYPNYEIEVNIDSEGEHSEQDWRKIFPHFYNWMITNK